MYKSFVNNFETNNDRRLKPSSHNFDNICESQSHWRLVV